MKTLLSWTLMGILTVLMCVKIHAQEDLAASAAPTADTNSAKEKTDEEWKPRFRVILQLTKDGQAKKMTKYEDVARIAYTTGNVTGTDGISRKVMTPVTRTQRVEVTVIVPGTAVLACDEISMTAAHEKSETYTFECQGRCRLMMSGLRIDGESAKLAQDKLTLTNATITKDQTVLTAPETTVPLKLFGVSTSAFDGPGPQILGVTGYGEVPDSDFRNNLQPQPDPSFQRSSRDDDKVPDRTFESKPFFDPDAASPTR